MRLAVTPKYYYDDAVVPSADTRIMTQPPPSTPAPRKFLLSKRPPQSLKTPGSGSSAFGSSQRFPATPRFALPSSTQRSSTQRLPSTSGFPGTARTSRRVDPIYDVLESSPPEAPPTATRSGRFKLPFTQQQRVKERIEIESDDESDLQEQDEFAPRPTGFSMNDSIEAESEISSNSVQSDIEERTPKRRRISVSSAISWQDDAEADIVGVHDEEPPIRYEDTTEEDEVLPDIGGGTGPNDDEDLSMDEDPGLPDPNQGVPVKTQPKFQQAPRFKILEAQNPRQEGLPEAFSPQRRGPKYIAGGLAAELQSWLAAVKGWGGGDRPPDQVMKIAIDEIGYGNRMYLVKGRRIMEDESTREEISARLMLAGEGRLTGLGQKASVVVGSRVAISQPAWEVVLEGDSWIVACDWAVF